MSTRVRPAWLPPQVSSDGRAAIRFFAQGHSELATDRKSMSLPRERHRNEDSSPRSPRHGTAGAIARIYWFLGGNVIVGYFAVAIAQHPYAWSSRDLAYWVAVASLVTVRYIDVALLDGTTADGDRATLSDWRRYSTFLLLICGSGWVGAHAVGLVIGR